MHARAGVSTRATLIAFAIMAGSVSAPAGPERDALARLADRLNVLVVTIDTLRPDRLGSYGYDHARTPVLDSIAASGVRFESAYAHQPVTLPSHATIFTGTHVDYHGVEDNGMFVLPDEAVTVAEELHGAGLTTGAVISAFVLHRQYGLDQGFDSYEDSLAVGLKQNAAGFEEIPATGVSDYALQWIDRHADERWFLWLHYYDPHGEFEPPPEFRSTSGDLYDGEIAYVDHELGRVVDDLKRRGLTARTMIVVTSDHGESLGEHGELAHGYFLYDATMRVPLLVSLPGTIPANRVVRETVSLVDVAPTVLSALGMRPPDRMQGRSLVPLFYGVPVGRELRPVLMETMTPWHAYGWSPSRALVAESFKLIEAPTPELYDLARDPGELENIIDENRPRARAMAALAGELRERYREARLTHGTSVELDDEARERLESLGYVFAGPGADDEIREAPDVKDMIEITRMTKLASELRARGEKKEAFALLEHALEKSPDARLILNQLGAWSALDRDFVNGEKYFTRLIELDPDYVQAYQNLGLLFANASRLEEATALAETVLSRFPRSAKAYGLLGMIRLKQEDYAGALEVLDTAIDLYPGYHEALSNRSFAHFYLRDFDKALEDVRAAHRIVPDDEYYARFIEQLEQQLNRAPE